MATFNYYLRNPKGDKPTPIVLFVHYRNKRFKIPTGERIDPKYWNFEKQEVKRTSRFPMNPEFNVRLRGLKLIAERELLVLTNNNNQIRPDAQTYKESLRIKLGHNNH